MKSEDSTTIQKVHKVKTFEPTPRQRKLAKAMSDNIRQDVKTETVKALMVKTGYSESQALKPFAILRGQGFLKAMAELGLTQELVTSSLVKDIEAKPGRRAFELSIAAKILGLDKRVVEDAPTINASNSIIVIQPPKDGPTEPLLTDI
jgi:hypothetical protein